MLGFTYPLNNLETHVMVNPSLQIRKPRPGKLVCLPEASQLVSGRAGIQTQPSLHLETLPCAAWLLGKATPTAIWGDRRVCFCFLLKIPAAVDMVTTWPQMEWEFKRDPGRPVSFIFHIQFQSPVPFCFEWPLCSLLFACPHCDSLLEVSGRNSVWDT